MGIDFNGLVNFGKQLAKNDGGVNPNVIEGESIKVFNTEVEKTAAAQGVDVSELYADTGVSSLLGVEVSKPVFDDNALNDMFALAGIAPKENVDTESRAVTSASKIEELFAQDVDIDGIEEVTSPEVASYVFNAPKGSISRITNLAQTFSEIPEELIDTAGQLAYYYADMA